MKLSFLLPLILAVVSCAHSPEPARCPSGAAACETVFAEKRATPYEHFSLRLDVIRAAVSSVHAEGEIIEALNTEAARGALMQLQETSRVYSHTAVSSKDAGRIDWIRKQAKGLEDALGAYQRAKSLQARVTASGTKSEPLNEAVSREVVKAEAASLARLKEMGWLPRPETKISEIEKELGKIEFEKHAKRAALAATAKYFEELRASVQNLERYFKSDNYTEEELDLGLHTVRRNLRKVTIVLRSFDGLFEYGELPAMPEARELLKKYGNTKYNTLPVASPGSVKIDFRAALLISRYVTELGLLKDGKETELDLERLLLEEKIAKSPKAARVRAAAIFGTTRVEADGRRYYNEYLKEDPLAAIVDNLRAELNIEEAHSSVE